MTTSTNNPIGNHPSSRLGRVQRQFSQTKNQIMKSEAVQTLEFLFVQMVSAQIDISSDMENYKSETNLKAVYIAGKVTGLDYDAVYLKFKKRQLELEAAGYFVINPCELIDKNCNWILAMKICLYVLQFADYINLLHDWQESEGATMEKAHADKLNIKVLEL